MNAATTKVSYDPSNFPALASIEERATELLNRAKGGAGELQKKLTNFPAKTSAKIFKFKNLRVALHFGCLPLAISRKAQSMRLRLKRLTPQLLKTFFLVVTD